MYGDIIERAQAVLDAFRRIQQCGPSVFRFPGRENACDELRRITEFFHGDPQLMAFRRIELSECLDLLHDLLAPSSQPVGGVHLDRHFAISTRRFVLGAAPVAGFDPDRQLDQQLTVPVRANRIRSAIERIRAFLLQIPAQPAEFGIVLIPFAETREHLGRVDVEIPSRSQLSSDPFELGFDGIGLGAGREL